MSFLESRYLQILSNHKIYNLISNRSKLKLFMEAEVVSVWCFNEILRRFQSELLLSAQPLNSESYKEVLKTINELSLNQMVIKKEVGQIHSFLELYLDQMENLGCRMEPIFNFFDSLELGVEPITAFQKENFPKCSFEIGTFLINSFVWPMHLKSKLLFFEWDPFTPSWHQTFLSNLTSTTSKDSHIENFWKCRQKFLEEYGSDFHARIVASCCGNSQHYRETAGSISQQYLKLKINMWNGLSRELHQETVLNPVITPKSKSHLQLVR